MKLIMFHVITFQYNYVIRKKEKSLNNIYKN